MFALHLNDKSAITIGPLSELQESRLQSTGMDLGTKKDNCSLFLAKY